MFQIDAAELRAALGMLKGAASRRPGIPALTGVLIEADGQRARLTTTDLETSVRVELEAVGDDGTVLVPFKMLAEAVKAAPAGRLYVDAGASVVAVGGASIRLLPAEDFPMLAAYVGEYRAGFDAAELVRAIGAVEPAASRDKKARPVYTGILLELADRGEAELTSTDSYRLHTCRLPAAVSAAGEGWSAIIPGRALREMSRVLGGKRARGRVNLYADGSAVTLKTEAGVELRSWIVEGQFPAWRQLVPDGDGPDGACATLELAETSAAIAAAAPFARGNPVRFELVPGMGVRMSASSPDLGAWSGTLERAEVSGEAVTVAYNPTLIGGAVAAAGDGARWWVRDGLKPCVLTSADGAIRALVMPVRPPLGVDVSPVDKAPASTPHEPTAAEREAGEPVAEPEGRGITGEPG
jgi:DNA polymerase-3 subunit beta